MKIMKFRINFAPFCIITVKHSEHMYQTTEMKISRLSWTKIECVDIVHKLWLRWCYMVRVRNEKNFRSVLNVIFFFKLVGCEFGYCGHNWPILQPRMIGDGDYGEIGGMKIGRGNRSTLRKPAPAPLCPPQIPHD
jgi:hypothetical protein